MKMGFCGHIGENWVDSPSTYTDALISIGAQIMREDLKWYKVEKSIGTYAFPGTDASLIRLNSAMTLAQSSGIDALLILDYGNPLYGPDEPPGYKGGLTLTADERAAFAAYANYCSGALSSRPVEYEIWNEWNIGLGSTATERADLAYMFPADYDALVRATYPAVKSANPSAFVWGGVLSDPMGPEAKNNQWFEEYINIPGWADYMDGFSFHHYLIPFVPEFAFWQVRGVAERARMKAGRPDMPVALSESGWFNGTDPFSVTEDVAADYYSRWPFLLRCSGLNKATFYDLRNDGTSTLKEDNFGVFYSDYSPKPAALVLADVLPAVHSAQHAEYLFKDNRHVVMLDRGVKLALWASNGDRTIRVAVTSSATVDATLKVAGGATSTVPIAVGSSEIEIAVTSRSKILTLPPQVTVTGFS